MNKQNVNIADEILTDYSFLKELFEKTISNLSLNFHAFWDTLYLTKPVTPFKELYTFSRQPYFT